MTKNEKTERWYWVWVTSPAHYLDENGDDIFPDSGFLADAPIYNWTCHKDTRKGDLIVLYRSRLNKDIGYLIKAESDARENTDSKERKKNWNYECDCKYIYKFRGPITLAEMKANHYLSKTFSALRAGFQKLAYHVSSDDWRRLNKMLIRKNPSYEKVLAKMERTPMADEIWREEHLEDKLTSDLKSLRKHGHFLKLLERQLICQGNGGRIDLLCEDIKKNCYVVVELKNVSAGQSTFGQISNYIGWVKEYYAKRKRVEGLVISKGSDVKFQSSIKNSKYRISQLNIEDLKL